MLPERRVRPSLEQLEDRCVPATITVTNLNDGIGVPGMTLREAIEKANLTIATDTIVFKAGLKGTLSMGSGQFEITQNLKINGPGASKITIDGNGSSRVFSVSSDSPAVIDVSIRNLSLTGESSVAVLSDENTTLANVRVFNSEGVIGNTHKLSILDSVIDGNVQAGFGGGLFRGDVLTISGSTFFDNRSGQDGGGLYIENASAVTITKSTFAENRAAVSGGAIYWVGAGTLTLNACSFISNRSASGGGGLFIDGGTHEILKSTIAYNSAGASGGGIQVSNGATVTLLNSTISSNRAAINGGGFSIASGVVTLHNCTVAYNQADGNGGGIHSAAPTVNLVSTIVARNSAVNNGNDLNSVTIPGNQFVIRNCLIEDANTTFADLDDDLSNVLGANPLLGPLKNNGGLTFTHALQAGSPAINTGSNPDSLTTDQRGAGFKRVKGAGIDIGAFER